MKRPVKLIYLIMLMAIGSMMYNLTSCTHDDDEDKDPNPGGTSSATELMSAFTTTPPTLDGKIDPVWSSAVPLKTTVAVPKLGNEPVHQNFYGYVGDTYNVSMRSMYDNENIYFLMEWNDPDLSLDRQTWYFDPTDNRWKQESQYPTFDASGNKTRDGFYEDKFAMLWNVDNTVSTWDMQTCYASCHTGLPAADGYNRHYTNSATEKIDMWHWKSVRDVGTMDDQFQDNTRPNGRKGDPKTGGGYSDNKQTLTITGTTTTVSVPKYFIPNKTNYSRVLQEEITSGTAKLITAVDAQGILTYNGGTIDPKVDKDFQRAGAKSGPKGIPSIVASRMLGNGGDISAEWTHTGSGFILEVKRKLNTGDTEKVDINFAGLGDQRFGIGVFDNSAVAHAIKHNLVLKFGKK